MVSKLVWTTLDRPRRSGVEIHAYAEGDGVQWRGEMEGGEAGTFNGAEI